jgi:DNA-binding transcriptional LysR family regulator
MDAWSDLSVFLAAAREGSATRAAGRLGLTVTTVSRRLAKLEEAAGRPLFVRSADGLALTPAGEALLPHAERVEQGALAGFAAVQALEERPSGRVDIALPGDMVHLVLLPHLRHLGESHPDLEIVLTLGTGLADLMRREADIAVRVIRPEAGEELVSTRLRDVENAVFAAPAYLETVRDPADPAAHRWITWNDDVSYLPEFRWLEAMVPRAKIALRTNQSTVIRHAAAAGLGAAVLPRLFGQLTPTLVEVPLTVPPPPPLELWMVTHRALRYSARVAATWSYLDARLRWTGDPGELEQLRGELTAAYGVRFSTANQSSS